MGYAGGSKENPTYRSLGDHTESIQVAYDPGVISYEELLDVFWASHNPVGRSVSVQYASIIFYHDEAQRELAEKTLEREEALSGREITTEIVPYTEFWLAEDYHQKYYLRGTRPLMAALNGLYPDAAALRDSTAAARLNGYVGGHGTLEQLDREINQLGLSQEAQEQLMEIVRPRLGQ